MRGQSIPGGGMGSSELSLTPPRIEIRSCPSDMRKFLTENEKIAALVGGGGGLLIAALTERTHLLAACALLALIGFALCSALVLFFAGLAWAFDRNVVISVDLGLLEVRYGSAVRWSVPVDHVRHFGLGPAMTLGSTWTAIEWPPAWPSALIVASDPDGPGERSMTTRRIIIWGKDELARAEEEIRQAIDGYRAPEDESPGNAVSPSWR